MEYTPLKFSSVYDDEVIDWDKVEEYYNETSVETEPRSCRNVTKSARSEVINNT